MSDPSNEQVMQEVKFATGMTMEPVVVEDDKLNEHREAAHRGRRQGAREDGRGRRPELPEEAR